MLGMWLHNSQGNPDSALTLKVFWTIYIAGMLTYFGMTDKIDPIVLLSFASGMLVQEATVYTVRRGQDNKLARAGMTTGPAGIPAPDVDSATERPPGPSASLR